MMHEIQVIETPREEGVSLKEVRAAIAAKFPKFKIAGLIEDKTEDVWRAKLVKKAEFPLKNMGPKDDEAMPGADGEDDEDNPKKPKFDDGDEEKLKDEDSEDDAVADDDAGDGESGGEEGNPKDKAEHLIKLLEKLLPELQHLLGGGDEMPPGDMGAVPGGEMPPDGGMPPAGPGADIGPHMAPGGPPAGGPPPPMPPAGPPHRPGVPGGRPRPGGRPMPGQVPAFAKRRTQLLERDADVDEKTARDELLVEFPEYTVEDMKRIGSRYVVKLAIRQ